MNLLFLLILSVFAAYGIAVALTQKGDAFPIRYLVNPLRKLLGKINPEAPKVFDCVVCMSFWTTLLTDVILAVATRHYFAWPLSGFITVGFSWTVMELLNAIDPNKMEEKPLDEAQDGTYELPAPKEVAIMTPFIVPPNASTLITSDDHLNSKTDDIIPSVDSNNA